MLRKQAELTPLTVGGRRTAIPLPDIGSVPVMRPAPMPPDFPAWWDNPKLHNWQKAQKAAFGEALKRPVPTPTVSGGTARTLSELKAIGISSSEMFKELRERKAEVAERSAEIRKALSKSKWVSASGRGGEGLNKRLATIISELPQASQELIQELTDKRTGELVSKAGAVEDLQAKIINAAQQEPFQGLDEGIRATPKPPRLGIADVDTFQPEKIGTGGAKSRLQWSFAPEGSLPAGAKTLGDLMPFMGTDARKPWIPAGPEAFRALFEERYPRLLKGQQARPVKAQQTLNALIAYAASGGKENLGTVQARTPIRAIIGSLPTTEISKVPPQYLGKTEGMNISTVEPKALGQMIEEGQSVVGQDFHEPASVLKGRKISARDTAMLESVLQSEVPPARAGERAGDLLAKIPKELQTQDIRKVFAELIKAGRKVTPIALLALLAGGAGLAASEGA